MITEKLKKLIELLIEKTKIKKAIWTKASGDRQFKLSINEGIAITVNEWEGQYNNLFYGVKIFNANGDVIERIDTEDFDYSIEEHKLMQSFHKIASDSYYKVDETLEALFNSVISQDVIGNSDEIDNIPNFNQQISADDDELPF